MMTWTHEEFRKVVNDIFLGANSAYINKGTTRGQDMSQQAHMKQDNDHAHVIRRFAVVAEYTTDIIVEGHMTEDEMREYIEEHLYVAGLEIGGGCNLDFSADLQSLDIECTDEEEWD
tara:strand:+ start:5871 stop:6221 length:351 start_codon:yes stop_codon:yes gene_type:complete